MRKRYSSAFLKANTFLALILITVVNVNLLNAQNRPYYEELYPSTPLAFSFMKYGGYPVNNNTGMVDMSVPIYNIKSGALTLPIDMSFHASGRIVNETNGFLGIRWMLNTGGKVTRTINGYPDEFEDIPPFIIPSEYIPTSSAYIYRDVWYNPTIDELLGSCREGASNFKNYGYDVSWLDFYDSEYDIFNYELPSGKRGKFILKNEDNGQKKVMTIPFDAVKIELNEGSINAEFYNHIKITDTDGTIYNYGSETSEDYVQYSYSLPFETPVMEWYLESIISADKEDSITFTYSGLSTFGVSNYGERQFWFDKVYTHSLFGEYDFISDNYRTPRPYENKTNYYLPILRSIQFKNGELSFNYDEDTDAEVFSYNKKILREITLSGDVNKKFKFNQAKGSNEQQIRYLNSLEVISLDGETEQVEKKYSFAYNEPASSSYVSNMLLPARYRDWWGYLNINAVDLLPGQEITIKNVGSCSLSCTETIGHSRVNREPDLVSMRYGMLESITYPTKGTTKFEYENNYYKDGTDIKRGPGLRISKIINTPIQGNQIIKTFKYGENEDGAGNILEVYKPKEQLLKEDYSVVVWDEPSYYDGYGEPIAYSLVYDRYRLREFGSESVIGPNDFQGSTIYYDVVNEYIGEDNNKSLRTEYVYYPKYLSFSHDPTTQEFLYSNVGRPKVFAAPFNEVSSQNFLHGGKLKSKTIYKRDDKVFNEALKEIYYYAWREFDVAWDMPTCRYVNFFFQGRNLITGASEKFYFEKNWGGDIPIVDYGFRKYVSGLLELSHKEVEHYTDSGVLSTTNVVYNDRQYSQVRSEESINSDGKVTRLEYEYPFDDLSVPINSKMVDLNMVGIPLKKSLFVNNDGSDTFLQSSRTLYGEWSPFSNNWGIDSNLDINIIRPRTQFFKKGSNAEAPIIEYHSYYDSGQVKEVSKKDGTSIYYIWGYNDQYPIAKIENFTVAQAEIIQTSLIDPAITASDNDNSVTKENTLRTKFNALRNSTALSEAQVTTYTYDPLIGVTSITDPKGYTTYYEYDDFNRLEFVKDRDKNIISENKYNYKNQ